MTKLITIKQILDLGPCKECDTKEKIIDKTDSDWPKTMLEISELDIPARDRLWVLSGLLDLTTAGHVACDVAESVLHLYEAEYPKDYRVRDCIATRRMWLDGLVDGKTFNTARIAGYYAANTTNTTNTATYAAICATCDAYFATSAACTATRTAVAWDKSLEILKKYL